MNSNSPIGVFDSGVGGISVLRILRHDMPNENYIFFGDSIRNALGYDFTFYDGAYGTARETKRRLQEAHLVNASDAAGTITLYSSVPGQEAVALQQKLLDLPFTYAPEN